MGIKNPSIKPTESMKTISTNTRRAGVLLTGIALGAGIISAGISASTAAETKAEGDSAGFVEKAQAWQDKMSESFRDLWQGVRGDDRGKPSVSTASFDLREQGNSHIIRLSLTGRKLENVKVWLEGGTLQILAPAEGKLGRYAQSVSLDGVVAGASVKTERKEGDGVIVITVPKGPSLGTTGQSSVAGSGTFPSLDEWDRDILRRMESMNREMDRIFADAFSEFRSVPEYKNYFDEARFGSSIDLKDEGDRYVVRAYLPQRDISSVNASVEDTTLKIEAKAESSPSESGKTNRTKAHDLQALTLPGPVKVDEMKVERKDGLVEVVLPKK